MTSREKELMLCAAEEIGQLKEANTEMGARLQMFDDVMMLLRTEPKRNGYGYSEDIRGQLIKYVESNYVKDSGEPQPEEAPVAPAAKIEEE